MKAFMSAPFATASSNFIKFDSSIAEYKASLGTEDENAFISKQLPGWKADYVGTATGNTAFHLACWLGSPRPIFDRLLELGSNIRLKNISNGYSPLHLASYYQNTTNNKVELVTLLLDRGCDPEEEEDCSGCDALHWASDSGYIDVVKLLLNRGCDVSKRDNSGRTPLVFSCSEGCKEIVQLLLDHGADICDTDQEGRTCLFHASDHGHKEIVQLLLDRGADIDFRENGGRTSLMHASIEGRRDVVELLLNRGADINAKDEGGWTSLMQGSQEGRIEVVDLLLKRGADINAKDNDNYNSLMYASSCSHKEVVQLLISRGSDISVKNDYGETSLTLAKIEDSNNNGILSTPHSLDSLDTIAVLRNWPVSMVIVVLQELAVYHLSDIDSFNDLLEFIGEEVDYLYDDIDYG